MLLENNHLEFSPKLKNPKRKNGIAKPDDKENHGPMSQSSKIQLVSKNREPTKTTVL
jgi:hypothetical protein